VEEGLKFETQAFALLFAGADMREGTSAFLERRPAKFGEN
jgi:enoyl-CoA hydratase